MTIENPLLDEFRGAQPVRDVEHVEELRLELVSRYSFAIPTTAALTTIAQASPNGVVEVGAGTGYWAMLLAGMGVDVIAFDADPPPSVTNPWFAGRTPWFDVAQADEAIAARHSPRTLLLVWPTRGAVWAADAVRAYHGAGGGCVAFIGEPPGGRTGDDSLHKLLGNVQGCLSCRYSIPDAQCTCSIPRCFLPSIHLELPHWPGFEDDLTIHQRIPSEEAARSRRRRPNSSSTSAPARRRRLRRRRA